MLESLSSMRARWTPNTSKSAIKSLFAAALATVTRHDFSRKRPIKVIIRLPAADEPGSGQTLGSAEYVGQIRGALGRI